MPQTAPTTKPNTQTSLALDVEKHVRQYFNVLGDNQRHEPSELYDLMLQQFEKPLFTVVYEHTAGNQSRMAQILGLNRGTLRKKLKTHGLIA